MSPKMKGDYFQPTANEMDMFKQGKATDLTNPQTLKERFISKAWWRVLCAVRVVAHYIMSAKYLTPAHVIQRRQRRMYYTDSTGNIPVKPRLRERFLDLFKSEESRRETLLKWVNSHIPQQSVVDFSTTWQDGIALCALLEKLWPGLCPGYRHLEHHNMVNNCRLGLRLARQCLNVPQNMISPEEMAIADNKTEIKIFHLISIIKCLSERKHIDVATPFDITPHCSIRGSGVNTGVTGKKARFTVFLSDVFGILDLSVHIKGPQNEMYSENIINLLQAGDSQPRKNMAGNRQQSSHGQVIGYLEDGCGNKFVRKVDDRYLTTVAKLNEIVFNCQCSGKGTFLMTYTPVSAGIHTISIRLQNNHVGGSPFKAKIYQPSDLNRKSMKDGSGKRYLFESLSLGSIEDVAQDLLKENVGVVSRYTAGGDQRKGNGGHSRLTRQYTVKNKRVLRRIITKNGEDIVVQDIASPTLSRQNSIATDSSDQDETRGYLSEPTYSLSRKQSKHSQKEKGASPTEDKASLEEKKKLFREQFLLVKIPSTENDEGNNATGSHLPHAKAISGFNRKQSQGLSKAFSESMLQLKEKYQMIDTIDKNSQSLDSSNAATNDNDDKTCGESMATDTSCDDNKAGFISGEDVVNGTCHQLKLLTSNSMSKLCCYPVSPEESTSPVTDPSLKSDYFTSEDVSVASSPRLTKDAIFSRTKCWQSVELDVDRETLMFNDRFKFDDITAPNQAIWTEPIRENSKEDERFPQLQLPDDTCDVHDDVISGLREDDVNHVPNIQFDSRDDSIPHSVTNDVRNEEMNGDKQLRCSLSHNSLDSESTEKEISILTEATYPKFGKEMVTIPEARRCKSDVGLYQGQERIPLVAFRTIPSFESGLHLPDNINVVTPKPHREKSTQVSADEILKCTGWNRYEEILNTSKRKVLINVPSYINDSDSTPYSGQNAVNRSVSEKESQSRLSEKSHYDIQTWIQNAHTLTSRQHLRGLPSRQSTADTADTTDSGIMDEQAKMKSNEYTSLPNVRYFPFRRNYGQRSNLHREYMHRGILPQSQMSTDRGGYVTSGIDAKSLKIGVGSSQSLDGGDIPPRSPTVQLTTRRYLCNLPRDRSFSLSDSEILISPDARSYKSASQNYEQKLPKELREDDVTMKQTRQVSELATTTRMFPSGGGNSNNSFVTPSSATGDADSLHPMTSRTARHNDITKKSLSHSLEDTYCGFGLSPNDRHSLLNQLGDFQRLICADVSPENQTDYPQQDEEAHTKPDISNVSRSLSDSNLDKKVGPQDRLFLSTINLEVSPAVSPCVSFLYHVPSLHSFSFTSDQDEEVEVSGLGLENGQVGLKNNFQIWANTSKNGCPTVSITGPLSRSVTEVTMVYTGDNLYEVIYEVTHPGLYVIVVKWEDMEVGDSPFLCKITY